MAIKGSIRSKSFLAEKFLTEDQIEVPIVIFFTPSLPIPPENIPKIAELKTI
jgi:hypothetical protein